MSSGCCGYAGNFFHGGIANQFGFHGERVHSGHTPFGREVDNEGNAVEDSQASNLRKWNILTGISMIPIVGQIFTGICLIRESRNWNEGSETRRWCVGMGIANLCLITYPFLLIAHLGATIGRMLTTQTNDEDNTDISIESDGGDGPVVENNVNESIEEG